ncbi:MAG: hypothetical protein ACRDOH_12510 [Streptosporangiaceae bacterium]
MAGAPPGRARTRDSIEAARARGRKGGRPPKLTGEQAALARQLYDARMHTVADIARLQRTLTAWGTACSGAWRQAGFLSAAAGAAALILLSGTR